MESISLRKLQKTQKKKQKRAQRREAQTNISDNEEIDEDLQGTSQTIKGADQEKREELHVVKYIKKKGLESLLKKYHISCKRHKEYKELCQLSYSQLNSPLASPIVQQCRGLILNEEDDWKVISFPYEKFFNYGEKFASEIDWQSARAYEKLDGSIITLYYYKHKWHVSTSSLPDGSGTMTGIENQKGSVTFADEFWRIWNKKNYSVPKDTTMCYMFEFISNLNVLVVRYQEERIVLHGCRSLITLKELHPEDIAKLNSWECAKFTPMHSIEGISAFVTQVTIAEEALHAAKLLNPMEQEGFVVVDKYFARIKAKSPQYVAIAHLHTDKGVKVDRQMLAIAKSNEGEEFLNYFPQWKSDFEHHKKRYDRLCNYIDQQFNSLSKGKFNSQLKQSQFKEVFLQMKQSKNAREVLSTKDVKFIEELLSQYESSSSNTNQQSIPPTNKSLDISNSEVNLCIKKTAEQILDKLHEDESTQLNRQHFLEKLQQLLSKHIDGIVEVKLFGSVGSGIGTKHSDLDVCILIPSSSLHLIPGVEGQINNAGEKVYYLDFVPQLLAENGMERIEEVKSARYPIVKFYAPTYDISCDVSCGNLLGLKKAEFIQYFCRTQPKYRDVVLCVKYWAKNRGINDPTNYTINSFVFALMTLYIFQINSLLPIPLMKQDSDELPPFPTYIYKPASSTPSVDVAQILLMFFKHFAYEFDYLNDAVSVRCGCAIKKFETMMSKTNTPMIFSVEDPFILSENCARTVSNHSLHRIRAEFNRAYTLLSQKGDFLAVCEQPKNKKEIKKWELDPIPYIHYDKSKPKHLFYVSPT